MPPYANNPFQVTPAAMVGVPCYLFGSQNLHQAPTRIWITNIVGSGTVATVGGNIVEGEIPKVGSTISISQTSNSAGAFNVNRATVTGATFDNTGFGTVTFASATTLASAPATGTAIVDVPEVGETIANGASIAVAVPYAMASDNKHGSDTFEVEVNFPTIPTTATVVVQGAMINRDANFATISPAVASVTGGSVNAGGTVQVTGKYNYIRFLVSGVAGTGTIAAKLFV